MFRQKETTLQITSLVSTLSIWTLLILIGLGASVMFPGKIGEDLIVALLLNISQLSPVFAMAFWVGGVAALFSTADMQIYSFMLVRKFDPESGTLRAGALARVRPGLTSLGFAVVFTFMYWIVRSLQVPFEKIIFIVIPMSLNILPAMFRAIRHLPQHPGYIWTSLVLYLACSLTGLLKPSSQLTWTLVAALVPVGVSIVALIGSNRRGD
jgi:hypothetical protein